MCRILKINQKRTCVYTHAVIEKLIDPPNRDYIMAVWRCAACGGTMLDVARKESEAAEFLRHIFANERAWSAPKQLRLWDNE